MKFTKEEISLCKQIYRKHGEILDTKWKPSNLSWKELAKMVKDAGEMQSWTISDCLEFLKMNFEALHWLHGNKTFQVEISSSTFCVTHYRGKTPLEACLKAVLAVLEEEK